MILLAQITVLTIMLGTFAILAFPRIGVYLGMEQWSTRKWMVWTILVFITLHGALLHLAYNHPDSKWQLEQSE